MNQAIKNKIKYVAVTLIFTVFINISSLTLAHAAVSASSLVSLANSARADAGLGSLSTNGQLESAAAAKANDMIEKDYFAHTSPDGRQPWDFIAGAGYNYVYAGENLAIGYESASAVHSAWMNSASHRDNILNPNYREVGIATASGEYQGAETTVVVQMFGSTSGGQASANANANDNENEVNIGKTPSKQKSDTPSNPKEFNIVTDKTNFSPAKVFAGSEVIFNAAITGDATDVNITVGDQKIAFAAPIQDGANKIYTAKAKVEKAGDFDVTLNISDKWGNKESKVLGKLTVAEKIVSKASIVKDDGFVQTNLVYILSALAVLALGAGGYLVFRYQKKQHKFA